jgi:hypothetical protein
MKRKLVLLSAVSLFIAPAAHAASPIDDFELNGSLANSAGGGATLLNNSGALGATGITFQPNGGPTVTGLPGLSTWTIDTTFDFDAYGVGQGGWQKIIDFSGLLSDLGVYAHGTDLSFFGLSAETGSVFTAGVLYRLTISRDALGAVTGWLNGTQVLTGTDLGNAFVIGSALDFFRDDSATGNREAESGFVDYIRVYDQALTPDNAGGPGVSSGVPEASTWAMILFGFGFVGAAMRRRTRQQVVSLTYA